MKITIQHFLLACIVTILTLQYSPPAYALRDSRPLVLDKRIHIMVYNPDDVFKFTGHYGYQSIIQFAPNEEVLTISMGDSIAWQVVPGGSRIFVKPIEKDATTNMTVLTSLRSYQFELHAKEAVEGINDEEMVFELRFQYPESDIATTGTKKVSEESIDLTKPGKYNLNYTFAGPEMIAPIKIFDDGEFTYFQFRDKNSDIPAFFLVDSAGDESLINYRVQGDYIVVERVAARFTLRHGTDIICIFNENMPYRRNKSLRPWWKFWGA